MSRKRHISIIIPTLNEAAYIRQTIDLVYSRVSDVDRLEVLVIDAGSSDGTIEAIRGMKVSVFVEPTFALKKYESLNQGLQMAVGEVVVFLDADTELPNDFDLLIDRCLDRKGVVAGAFEFSFSHKNFLLQLLEWANQMRYRFGQVYYGDQAVFCLKEVAIDVGGVPERQLMESAYFCKRLKREGRLCLVKEAVKTSPRRFTQHGFWKISWFDFVMWLRFVLDLPVEQYARRYWGINMNK